MVAEPIHALTYFAPESHAAFEADGPAGILARLLRRAQRRRSELWMRTWSWRRSSGSIPTSSAVQSPRSGRPPLPPAPSTLDSKAPAPRSRRIAAPTVTEAAAGVAVGLLREAIERTSVAGRPLFAANAELDWPGDPVGDLWHAVTLLREHRGDGHVNALSVAELDACEAHVLRIADDDIPVASIQPYRGWSAEDWTQATQRLRARRAARWRRPNDTGRSQAPGSHRSRHGSPQCCARRPRRRARARGRHAHDDRRHDRRGRCDPVSEPGWRARCVRARGTPTMNRMSKNARQG